MYRILTFLSLVVLTAAWYEDLAAQQTILFKEKATAPIGIMTTSAGAPVEYKDTATLNSNLIRNEYFIEAITKLNRERIPERTVHAVGAGAFGYFELTHDISNICAAELFSGVGKKTPIAIRFSLVIQEKGSVDTTRDIRGFAVKFYTQEGNFDIVGLNAPIFSIKDPVFFTTFIHAQKKNPTTNLYDVNTFWDFFTTRTESLHLLMYLFSDRGTPDGFRQMPGFGVHTYQVHNDHGKIHFVKFHFVPDLGIQNLTAQEAKQMAGDDPSYATKDLYNAIANGVYPTWTVKIQIADQEDAKNLGFDISDTTKVLPQDKFPLHEIGRLVLDRNPKNYFAEIEQLAFCPGNLVRGILGGSDKLFESRRLSYRDAQYYRLGANFQNIPVNCPFRSKVLTYNRDGRPPIDGNMEGIPNYYPNSFNGPVPYVDHNKPKLIEIRQDDKADNLEQITNLFINEFTEADRQRLYANIADSLGRAAPFLQERAFKLFGNIHPQLLRGVREALQNNHTHK